MNAAGATLALGVCLAWVFSALLGLAFAPVYAFAVSAVLAFGLMHFGRNTLVINALFALFAPLGVMLPAVALRDMLVGLGFEIPGFALAEVAAFAAAYLVFLFSAFGGLQVNIYRFGYAPASVGAMVLTLCLYALASSNWFLALIAVMSHLLWAAGLGSSNWFDHVLHVLLLPIALVICITQVL